MLTHLDRVTASAFNEDDKKNIFEIIETDVDGGFDSLDENIKHRIGDNLNKVCRNIALKTFLLLLAVCMVCVSLPVVAVIFRSYGYGRVKNLGDVWTFLQGPEP